jgi:hypothetical protein
MLKLRFREQQFRPQQLRVRLPTPATAAATSDATAFASFVTTAATAGRRAAAPSAAKVAKVVPNMANDATPTADQNRKAHTAAATTTTAQARPLSRHGLINPIAVQRPCIGLTCPFNL